MRHSRLEKVFIITSGVILSAVLGLSFFVIPFTSQSNTPLTSDLGLPASEATSFNANEFSFPLWSFYAVPAAAVLVFAGAFTYDTVLRLANRITWMLAFAASIIGLVPLTRFINPEGVTIMGAGAWFMFTALIGTTSLALMAFWAAMPRRNRAQTPERK